jgi:lipopolysaccharide/colanic/teichoic acid biosynthesis glycosyltransferase
MRKDGLKQFSTYVQTIVNAKAPRSRFAGHDNGLLLKTSGSQKRGVAPTARSAGGNAVLKMLKHAGGPDIRTSPGTDQISGIDLMPELQFRKALALEEKRAERSRRRFILMLLESDTLLKEGTSRDAVNRAIRALAAATRETDIRGWYKAGSVIGVIFTELGAAEGLSVARALMSKVTQALSSSFGIEEINKVAMSFHVYPQEAAAKASSEPDREARPAEKDPHGLAKCVKRALDIGVSLLMLLFCAPLMLAIALAVKITSPGPVVFRQKRIGCCGVPFTFLKFRTMYEGSDLKIHQEFVTRFIKREIEPPDTHYKLTSDPRVTRLGAFLRKTSMDELPQFLNVLLGDMSLVGPRPAIPYELESYQPWHRRRVIDVKPGITGLWQVSGRSRVTFDNMVRLDLRYAKSWSLWLDLRILLETPRAVLSGAGAY